MSAKSLGANAFKYDKVLSLSRQASDEMWELRRLTGAQWFGSAKVGGLLAFGPTFVDDFLNNYNHHAKLEQKFNYKQFAVDSAKNQTGNLAGAVGGFAVAKLAVIVFGFAGATVTGAPLIIIGLGAGALIAAGYNISSAPNHIEKKAKVLFGAN